MKSALVFPRTRYPSGDAPLGVAYLAAALRENTGEPPKIIDTTFAADPLSRVEAELNKERYDLVGISAMVTMAREAHAAARLAKQINPSSLVIMGGPHPTTLPAEVLKDTNVDAVCVGEGEQTLVEAVSRGGVEGVPGLLVRGKDGEPKGALREMTAELDALPFPALELLPMAKYLAHWFQLDAVRPGIQGVSVLATRGCPFRCSYCQPTLDRLFGKGLRKRSPRNVIEELRLRKEQLGVQGFLFADDTFIADRKWVLEFCDELERSNLDLVFGCNVRADLVDRDLLEKMRAAGLAKIYIGIEVFDDELRREVFNKRLTREQVEQTVEAARALEIRTQGYFMLGAPGEDRRSVRKTIRYARRLGLDDATFNLTTPLPGTYLFEKHQDRVTAAPEEMDYYRRWSFRPERGLDQGWLHRRQVLAYTGFYLRPFRLMRQLSTLLSLSGANRFLSKLRRVV